MLDLRTLIPLDKEAILSSVGKTGRAVIVHEACLTGGFGGEIAAVIADEGFTSLKAPIKRVAGPDTPVPFSPAWNPSSSSAQRRSAAAVRTLL